MKFRYPDDPVRLPPSSQLFLNADKDGGWLAQPKLNGWRRAAYKENGNWSFVAKRDNGLEARKPLPPDLLEKFSKLPIPDGTALDMEWMGMRDAAFTGGKHWLAAFDIFYWNYEWMGGVPQEERLKSLSDLMAMCQAADFAKIATGDSYAPFVMVPTWTTGVCNHFFRLQREYEEGQGEGTLCEGLVMKRRNGKLKGDFSHCVENTAWVKVKYREE